MQEPDSRISKQGEKAPAPPGGFFQQLFSFLLGSSDPEKEKKRLLKDIAKNLKRLKTRHFNPKVGLAEPGLARLFFELYKTLGPAQALLSHADASNALKSILIEGSFSKEQTEIKEKMSEESIRERANQANPGKLTEELKTELKSFFSFFDINTINEINNKYKLLSILFAMINFDYYFFLKKFDSRLQEWVFNYNPRFEAINGQYINDELKDFLETLRAFDPGAKWNQLLEVLNEYRGVEVISRDAWKKLLQLLRQVQKTNELVMIIQLIDGDPFYKPKPGIFKEKIVEAYLSKIKNNTDLTIQKIVRERRAKKIDDLAVQIFGTPSISRLVNYTEKANIPFSKKMLGGYTLVTPLNYLKAFLLDYVKKNVRQVVDLLLIPGQWSDNTPSQMLSESFHQLLKISDEITIFDESLAEDGEQGKKVQNTIYKADRDKQMMNYLRQTIKKINDQAQAMIVRCGQNCITLGKILKQVMEDYTKKHSSLIINWKMLEGQTDQDIRKMLISVYKQLYYFLQLMKFYI